MVFFGGANDPTPTINTLFGSSALFTFPPGGVLQLGLLRDALRLGGAACDPGP